jgi:hypothetical protein
LACKKGETYLLVPQVQLQPQQRTRLRAGKPKNGCSILAAVRDFYFLLFNRVQIGSMAQRSSHSTGTEGDLSDDKAAEA